MADLKKFLDQAGVTHLWGKITTKMAADIAAEAEIARAAEKKNADAAAAADAKAVAAQQTADAKVASVTAGDASVTVAGTATAPTVAAKISAEAGNDLVLKTDGLYVEVPAAAEYTVVKDENAGEYAAVYHLTKDGVNIGAAINIPKDLMVKSGSVIGNEIVLVLNDANNTEIKIPASALIEYVTGGTTAEIVVSVDETTHVVTASIVDGSIVKGKLATDVQTTLNKADSALQAADIVVGGANGTISVKGNDVEVKGLGSAAFENTTAFDPAGSASAAQEAAKGYTDAEVKKEADRAALAEQGLGGRLTTIETIVTGTGDNSMDKKIAAALTEAKGYTDTEINTKVIALTTAEIDAAIAG